MGLRNGIMISKLTHVPLLDRYPWGADGGAECDFEVPMSAFRGFSVAIGAHVFNKLQVSG